MNSTTPKSSQYKEVGTSLSGYDTHGPYSCKNCIHRVEENCVHPVVKVDLGNGKDGDVKIDVENGCCRFVRPDLTKPVSTHPLLRVIQSKIE